MADQKVKVRIEAKDAASPSVDKVEGRFKRLGNSIKANALKITAALGAALLAFRAIEESATLASQTEALKRNLATQGVAFDDFISKLKEVSDGTVSTSKLIQSSSKALLLGIPADKISELLEVARVSSIATGDSVAKAFDDIATGIGRASPMILDNLGIIVKLGPAYSEYAKQIGKATEELTAAEQKQALLNEVLKVGAERVKDFGDAQSEATLRILQGRAAMENFKDSAGTALSSVVLALSAAVTRSAAGFILLGRAIAEVVGAITGLMSYLPIVGKYFEDISSSAKSMGARLGTSSRKMIGLANSMTQAADAALAAQLGIAKSGDAALTAADAYAKAAEEANNLASAAGEAKTATEKLGDALGVVTSIELAGEIAEITKALEKSREELGANSDEYVRLEELAGDKIEKLRERIQSLKDGMGDLKSTTAESAGGLAEYGNAAEAAAGQVDVLTGSVERNAGALGSQATMASAAGPLFPGLSGTSHSYTAAGPPRGAQLTYTSTGAFYRGRQVRTLPDGRLEFIT